MDVKSAVTLIHNLVYKPGWELLATDFSDRFEGTVKLSVAYPAFNGDKSPAIERKLIGDWTTEEGITGRAAFVIFVDDCNDEELYKRVLLHFLAIEEHEAREFLRVRPTYWAPFHPHRVDGMKRWGKPESDFTFGVA